MPEKKADHIGEFRTIPGTPPTWCRMRIYETDYKPLILLSAVEENRGPHLAGVVEVVSTEVVVEHLPHLTRSFPSITELLRKRRGLEVPFTVIEHNYIKQLWKNPERLFFVEFSDAMVRHRGRGVRRLGSYRYKEAPREEIERLIGEPV